MPNVDGWLLERVAFVQMREHLEENSVFSNYKTVARNLFKTEVALVNEIKDRQRKEHFLHKP